MNNFKTFFSNLKIREKLLLSFGTVTLILLIAGTTTFFSLTHLDNAQEDILKSYSSADAIMEIKFTISQDLTLLMEMMVSTNNVELEDLLNEHGHLSAEFDKLSSELNKLILEEWGNEHSFVKNNIMKEMLSVNTLYKTKIDKIIIKIFEIKKEMLSMNVKSVTDSITYQALKQDSAMQQYFAVTNQKNNEMNKTMNDLDTESDNTGKEIFKTFAALEDSTGIMINSLNNTSQVISTRSKTLNALMIILGFIISITLTFIVSNRISKPIVQLKSNVEELEQGNFPEKMEMTNNGEIGLMVKSVNSLIDTLHKIAEFASAVGHNKLDSEVSFNSEGMLGKSLITMRNNLKNVAEEDKKRNWAAEGLAKFAEILRSNNELKSLGNNIISNLVKYVNANQGGLFIINNNDKAKLHLELVACYAYQKKKYLEKTIQIGEGLIGQAYLEQATIYMTDVPDGYVEITSGLGYASPRSILIVPLKINDEVEGMIEIASFTPFEPHEITFIEKLAENIASTLSGVKVNERTKRLLQESQQQSEELKSQEEEMKQNMEEMVSTQEEMQRKEKDYLEQMKALQNKINELTS